jgi:hypothetical protein
VWWAVQSVTTYRACLNLSWSFSPTVWDSALWGLSHRGSVQVSPPSLLCLQELLTCNCPLTVSMCLGSSQHNVRKWGAQPWALRPLPSLTWVIFPDLRAPPADAGLGRLHPCVKISLHWAAILTALWQWDVDMLLFKYICCSNFWHKSWLMS